MELVLPRIALNDVTIVKLTRPIANPKAVAAQALISRNAAVAFHESRLWEDLAALFQDQFTAPATALPPLPGMPGPSWIAFPYAVHAGVDGCLVWIEPEPKRQRVCHVRLHRDEDHAARANAVIRTTLAAFLERQSLSSTSPVPSQR